MNQLESLLLYLTVSAVFSGISLYKLWKNKVKIENASGFGLLSLLILEIVSFFILSESAGLVLFSAACIIYLYSIPDKYMLPMEGKSVLITGCDSGLGHALAKHLDELGVLVFAGVLDKKGPGAEALKRICSPRLSLIQLDVTNVEEIKKAYTNVKSRVQDAGLWGIVHNAGVLGYVTDGELLPINVYRQCMEVNFFGAVQITKMFISLVRKAKGRLISISSMAGHTPIPGFAAYGASKAALSMFSAVMRQDLFKWGVKVSTIHPSGFKTNIFGSQEHWRSQDQNILDNVMPDVKEDYGSDYLSSIQDLHHKMFDISSADLSPVLEDVCHALLAENPHATYTPGKFAYFIPCLAHYFPLWVYDYFSKQVFPSHKTLLPRSLRISQVKNKTL
ncbi:17-beta-hydroxysteroid dehydrogenase type 2 [Bombina bombina]|uniref:17-beta-hydroxysteroid dehydrogenase type 2 n=1 Tax=Bombina bombina TaxID=8345 RepID=UPI00235A7C0F|nr:17-beta-hydroxysteroid dehydrogenase type 2 [Bombina bombina]